MSKYTVTVAACLVVAVAFTSPAAASIDFFFNLGERHAMATFDVVTDGGNDFFEITLVNTSGFDVMYADHVLTGVFFNLAGVSSLDAVSAVLTAGSEVLFPAAGDGLDSNDEVGGEYGFIDDLNPPGPAMVVSAVGLGDHIGPSDLFPGESLWGPPSEAPDGLGYGITSAGDEPDTGNSSKVSGPQAVPLVQNGVIFRLSGLPGGFSLEPGDVSNVWFNYGTDLDMFPSGGGVGKPPPVIPLPPAVWSGMLLLGGMAVVSGIRRRLRRV